MSETKSTPPKKSNNSPLWIALFILFLLISGSYAIAWHLWQSEQLYRQQVSNVAETTSKTEGRLSKEQSKLADRLTSLEADTKNIQKNVVSLDKQALFNSKQLNSLHGSSRADWLMAEAEYLLRLANQRLNMEKDYRGAESILFAADKVLAEIDDPGLYPVRKTLAQEILALQEVRSADREGVYLKLQAVINKVETLTQRTMLKPEVSQPMPKATVQTPVESSLWEAITSELKKAVRYAKLETPPPALLTAENSFYLKQNLRLMLEQAQLALLKQEQTLYDTSLDKAEQWIQTYFLISSETTKQLFAYLNELKGIKVSPAVPDISTSLRQLKLRIENLYRQHRMGDLETKTGGNGDSQ